MDSCSPSSPAPRAAAERTKSHRAPHTSLASAAAASSKPRKPSAAASKPSARLHPPTFKIPAPPHGEKKADIEPAVILQGLPSPKSGEKFAARNEASRKEKAVVKDEASKGEKDLVADEDLQGEKAGTEDEALKEMKAVAEDEYVGTEKAAAKDGALIEEMTVYIDEALRKASIQSDVSPLQEINQNDIAEQENTEGHDCTENNSTLAEKEEKKGENAETYVTVKNKESLVATDIQEDGVPFDQTEKEAVSLMLEKEGTDTENACTGQTVLGCLKQMEGELDVKQSACGLIFTEHLDSEQEGFLFAKGEPIQSSESLPAAECSTLKKFKEQDVSSLSQFETAVIAASDLKAAPSANVLDVDCNGISSMPSSEDTGFIEAAMIALARCPALENVHCISAARSALSCPWKLSRRAFVIPCLVAPALLCLLCFASAVTQDEGSYLHPT